MDDATLQALATGSRRLSELHCQISTSIRSIPPFSLGYPGSFTQSSYYPGDAITEEEVALASKVLDQNSIFPENTRLRKAPNGTDYELLVASVETGPISNSQPLSLPGRNGSVTFVYGDHSSDLERLCTELSHAIDFTANDLQKKFLASYIGSFQTGSLETYRDSLRTWVRDKAPTVENIFGFVEPYRDPHGTRAEFEGLVAIADLEETKLLSKLVESSAKFIRRLPWATPENDGKGPFEKNLFDPPDFSSITCKSRHA